VTERRGILVYNPRAGGRDRRAEVEALARRAASRGVALRPVSTERAGHATELVRAALAHAPDLIVVCGGDGTVAEAAAGLAGSEVPLAVLPAGTTNVIAREFGLGLTIAEAERHLTSARTAAISAWPVHGAGDVAPRVSLIGVGVSFDARVMGRTVPVLKRLFGRVGIGWTATIEWLKYEFPDIAIEGIDAAGVPFSVSATFALAANTKRYGGDPILSPHAEPGSELLDLILFTGRTKASLFRFYHGLSGGKAAHLALPYVSRLSVRSFTATSRAGYELDVQVDGDCVARTPVTVGPAATPVRILVPEP
jgi:diacylglycerol kinase family enzyme